MTNLLREAVAFAKFCRLIDAEPHIAADLVSLIRQSAIAYVRWNNRTSTQEAYNKTIEAVDACALAGDTSIVSIDWPGLYPVFKTDDGLEIYSIPCL